MFYFRSVPYYGAFKTKRKRSSTHDPGTDWGMCKIYTATLNTDDIFLHFYSPDGSCIVTDSKSARKQHTIKWYKYEFRTRLFITQIETQIEKLISLLRLHHTKYLVGSTVQSRLHRTWFFYFSSPDNSTFHSCIASDVMMNNGVSPLL